MPEKDDELQPKLTDIQPDDQEDPKKLDEQDGADEFEPKLSAKEYAKKWREAQHEAREQRKKRQALEAEKQEREKAALKEQGKWKEMHDALLKEHTGLKGIIEETSRSVAFRQEAIRQGCAPELVELLEKSASLSDIELDEKYRPSSEQVKFEVEKLREKYGDHFFRKDARAPKNGPPKKPEKEPEFTSEVRAAKSQRELDAVLKKFGRS